MIIIFDFFPNTGIGTDPTFLCIALKNWHKLMMFFLLIFCSFYKITSKISFILNIFSSVNMSQLLFVSKYMKKLRCLSQLQLFLTYIEAFHDTGIAFEYVEYTFYTFFFRD